MFFSHLNKDFISISILFLILITSGCSNNGNKVENDTVPFVFRSLHLKHKNKIGDKDWDLISPEAIYDIEQRLVKAQKPKIILYKDNQPSVEVNALLGTIIDDGEVILLEGNVRFKRVILPSYLITADKIKWNINSGEIYSSGSVLGTRISSDKSSTHNIKGINLSGNSKSEFLIIEKCRIEQQNESLISNSCKYNWSINRLIAIGEVYYSRKQLNQITKSDRMEFDLDQYGNVIFSSNKSQVTTLIEF